MAMRETGGRMTELPSWHAFAVALRRPPTTDADCTITPIDAGWQLEWAGRGPRDWEALAASLFGETPADPPTSTPYTLSQSDANARTHTFAAFVDGERMVGALLVQPSPLVDGREWLIARLGSALGPSERFRLMAGRPSGVLSPRGPTVCFCCDVGRSEIVEVIRAGCATLAMVGERTRAGTNCGNCRPNVARLIDSALSAGAG